MAGWNIDDDENGGSLDWGTLYGDIEQAEGHLRMAVDHLGAVLSAIRKEGCGDGR